MDRKNQFSHSTKNQALRIEPLKDISYQNQNLFEVHSSERNICEDQKMVGRSS